MRVERLVEEVEAEEAVTEEVVCGLTKEEEDGGWWGEQRERLASLDRR